MMRICRGLIATFLSLSQLTSPAAAQAKTESYPSRTITLVVAWPPGGLTDRLGRMMAQNMAKSLGTTVIVDNRAGASGVIGAEYVMRAPPDGYTLLVQAADTFVKLIQDKGTDPATDFTQISMLATVPLVLVAGPKFQRERLNELIEEAKRRPGEIAYGSLGQGGATHYGMEKFSSQAGIQLLHVPYRGTTPVLTDVLGGQVELTLLSPQSVEVHIRSNKVRALATTSPSRLSALPDIPTFGELGFPEIDLKLWYGIIGPKGMPGAVIQKLNATVKEAAAEAGVQRELSNAFAQPLAGTPEEMDAFLRTEGAKWKSMIRQ